MHSLAQPNTALHSLTQPCTALNPCFILWHVILYFGMGNPALVILYLALTNPALVW